MVQLAAGRQPLPRRPARRVVVTRPIEQGLTWVESLKAHGVDAVAVPLIDIAEAPDPAAVDAVWANIADWSLLVFVSPNAVEQFFARRPDGRAWPATLHAASPGPGTSSVLRARGVAEDRLIEPAADAASFDSEALWQQLRLLRWQGARVLVVRGEGGRDWLAARLREAGADVHYLAAYSRGPALSTPAERRSMAQALAEPERHLWFFSSSEAVGHLLESGVLAQPALQAALANSCALATHPRIADSARAAGFGTVLQCRPGLADVVACIQSSDPLDFSSASRVTL